MFDRYEGGDYAILVHVDFPTEVNRDDLSELKLLANSSGVETRGVITTSRGSPTPKYFVGSGKAEEIAEQVKALDANIVIFTHPSDCNIGCFPVGRFELLVDMSSA